jgi:hypothetical protein
MNADDSQNQNDQTIENAAETATNRREFFKKVLFYTSAGAAIQIFAKNQLLAADAPLKPVAADPACQKVAAGLGYVEDLAKALKAHKIQKKDMPGAGGAVTKAADQRCENCALFNMLKKTPAVPSCALIQNCAVNPKGSCNSFAPKPA